MSKEQDAVEVLEEKLYRYRKESNRSTACADMNRDSIEALSLAIEIIPEYVELKKKVSTLEAEKKEYEEVGLEEAEKHGVPLKKSKHGNT